MDGIITIWVLFLNGTELVSWEGDLPMSHRPELANRHGVLDSDYAVVRKTGNKTWCCAGNMELRTR